MGLAASIGALGEEVDYIICHICARQLTHAKINISHIIVVPIHYVSLLPLFSFDQFAAQHDLGDYSQDRSCTWNWRGEEGVDHICTMERIGATPIYGQMHVAVAIASKGAATSH
jgi:hypothetical protein